MISIVKKEMSDNFYIGDTEDDNLTSILNELKNTSTEIVATPSQPIQYNKPNPDELEDFILDNGAKTVANTQHIISILLNQIESNPDPELITSVAEMVSANNKALESMNKIYLTKEKHKQTKELESIKAAGKANALENNMQKPPMTREELFEILYGDKKVKDAKVRKLN